MALGEVSMATWTTEAYQKLLEAIASGAREIFYGGPPARRVVFDSLDEKLRLKAIMERDLGLTDPARKTGFLSVDRGL